MGKLNLYDLLVISGLIGLFTMPILIVSYTFMEPPIPLVYFITIIPSLTPLVIPNNVSLSLSFLWTILGLIQAFNIANVTRERYRLVLAWVILILTVLIQYITLTMYFIPSIEFWADAYRSVDINFIPPILLNSGLLFYSFTQTPKTEFNE